MRDRQAICRYACIFHDSARLAWFPSETALTRFHLPSRPIIAWGSLTADPTMIESDRQSERSPLTSQCHQLSRPQQTTCLWWSDSCGVSSAGRSESDYNQEFKPRIFGQIVKQFPRRHIGRIDRQQFPYTGLATQENDPRWTAPFQIRQSWRKMTIQRFTTIWKAYLNGQSARMICHHDLVAEICPQVWWAAGKGKNRQSKTIKAVGLAHRHSQNLLRNCHIRQHCKGQFVQIPNASAGISMRSPQSMHRM